MHCKDSFEKKNFSLVMLNYVFNDDSGSWWWWTNEIGTLIFGIIGLIGNLICFFVIKYRSSGEYSFVIYLQYLSIFDFFTLVYELNQTMNDLFVYFYEKNLLNFGYSFVCKLYDYSRHSIILLSSWTIVSLTIDRFLLVCHKNVYRKYFHSKHILILILSLSLLINLPEFYYKEWICRPRGIEYSAAYSNKKLPFFNQTKQFCSCRISPHLEREKRKFYMYWTTYIYHLLSYTLIPSIILLISNFLILKELYKPRRIISNQNELIRSRLTLTLSFVSILYLCLYIPYAIVQILSYFLIENALKTCNLKLILTLHQSKRLSELLNIIAMGLNFFFYILGIKHYRLAIIRMFQQ